MTCVCTHTNIALFGFDMYLTRGNFPFQGQKGAGEWLFFSPFQEVLVRPENDALACGANSAISNGNETITAPSVQAICKVPSGGSYS